jgi:hypothetical protein
MSKSNQINEPKSEKERLFDAYDKLLNVYIKDSGDSIGDQIENLKKAINGKDFFLAFGSNPRKQYKDSSTKVKSASKDEGPVKNFFEIDYSFMPILEGQLSKLIASQKQVDDAVEGTGKLMHYRADTIVVKDQVLILNVHKEWEPLRYNSKPYIEVLLHGENNKFIRLNCLISTTNDFTILPAICAQKLNIDLSKGFSLNIPNTSGASNLAKQVNGVTLEINGKTGKVSCVFVAGNLAVIDIKMLLNFTCFGINENGWFFNDNGKLSS